MLGFFQMFPVILLIILILLIIIKNVRVVQQASASNVWAHTAPHGA